VRKDRQACSGSRSSREAKIELSTMVETEINCHTSPRMPADPGTVAKLTRARLQQLTSDLVDRTIAPVRQALSDASLKAATSMK